MPCSPALPQALAWHRPTDTRPDFHWKMTKECVLIKPFRYVMSSMLTNTSSAISFNFPEKPRPGLPGPACLPHHASELISHPHCPHSGPLPAPPRASMPAKLFSWTCTRLKSFLTGEPSLSTHLVSPSCPLLSLAAIAESDAVRVLAGFLTRIQTPQERDSEQCLVHRTCSEKDATTCSAA